MEPLRTLRAPDLVAVMSAYRDVLRSHQEAINRLNVYPVPDGYTGTNMVLTVESVVSELRSRPEPPTMAAVCQAVAHGSLMGARGNSGVILSQLLRGFTRVLTSTDGRDPGGAELARALAAASEAATQAVLRPVEGTILTVARAAAEGAGSAADAGQELVGVLEAARSAGADALARTPELLPVLAQAGVVDAGGAGFVLLLDAFLAVADGRPLPAPPDSAPAPRPVPFSAVGEPTQAPEGTDLRYEVMYLLEAHDDTIPAFKEVWAGLGDSIVVVGGDGLWNCHIHTNDIGGAIEAALDAGRPRSIRVTDLLEQVEEESWVRRAEEQLAHEPEPEEAGPPQHTAVIAVATGDGIRRIFHSLGVRHIVAGGQSMNPSTAEILEMIDEVPAAEVVILPNNKNIFAVARQAAEVASKPARVVPTEGIQEGFAALMEYDPEATAEDNAAAMATAMSRVVAGEVTQAVRSGDTPAGEVAEGDWIGLTRNGVEVIGTSAAEAACLLLDRIVTPAHEIVTIIEGAGARPADTRRITEWLAEHRPGASVDLHDGGQPLYRYLVSAE